MLVRTAKSSFLIVRYFKTATRECSGGIVGSSPTKNTPLGNGLCDFFTPITQLVEYVAHNDKVGGSIPSWSTNEKF